MDSLLGRDRELAEIAGGLATARSTNVALARRIAGRPGVGKTTLLAAAEHQARATGWLSAHVETHRIQSALPLVAARRLADAILQALGADAPRYAGGLALSLDGGATPDPAALREGVLRLAEGVLHDFPLLIGIDDAQWIDAESAALLEDMLRAFSDRPIALLVAERSGEGGAFATLALPLELGPVSLEAGASLVRAHYAGAPDAVIDAIVEHAQGLPFDIIALAAAAREAGAQDADGVHASVRAAVAGEVHRLRQPAREFLQICSLIAEPIDYGTLVRMWPEETLSTLMQEVSGKYLVQDGTALRFTHSAIAESVRQTMSVEIPYRRRIIAALMTIESPSLEERERVIQQAAACGDDALRHEQLLLLAAQATRESALFTASNAYERAFATATPKAADLIRTYLEYASVLTMQGRTTEAAGVLQRALADTTAYRLEDGAGAIAALYLVSQWATKGYRAALEALEPLMRRFGSDADRIQLLSVAAWLYACADDRANFELCKNELLAHPDAVSPEIRMRVCVAGAHLAVHRGEADAAASLIETAVAEAGAVASANRRSAEVSRALIHFLRLGPRDIETMLPVLRIQKSSDQTQVPMLAYLRALSAFAKGEIFDAREFVSDALARPVERPSRRRLLGIAAAIGALTGTPTPHDLAIREDLMAFAGAPGEAWSVPMAAWHAVALSRTEPAQARRLVEGVMRALEQPAEVSTLNFPIALVLAAARLQDRPLLERLHDLSGLWTDRAPWMIAQRDLAVGFAAKALARPDAQARLTQACESFSRFESPLFVALSRTGLDAGDTEASAFLSARGISAGLLLQHADEPAATGETRRKGTTVPSRRELEVIALISDGQTNKAIAETLFLSERTVEAHIANVFNKLGVTSRTQVAAWYLSATASSHPHGAGRTLPQLA